jgi:hypothetical protein
VGPNRRVHEKMPKVFDRHEFFNILLSCFFSDFPLDNEV